MKAADKPATPEAQLKSFIAQLDPKDQKLVRAVRSALRKRFPAANELAYDYSGSLVVAYSATENGIDGFLSFAARADGVSLYFSNGPKLPDPKKLLRGSAKQVRYIPLESASRLAHPDVQALIEAAAGMAKVPLPARGKGTLLIRGAAAKPAKRRKA